MKVHLAAVSAMALCVGLSACGDFPQPQYPVSQPVAPPPAPAPQVEPAPAPAPAPAADPNAPTAKPSTPVESSTLAPPPGARTAPARPPKPGAFLDRGLDVGRPSVDLAVWRGGDDAVVYPAAKHHRARRKPAAEAAESETVKVGKGDTLASIARAHDSSVEELAKLNGLKSPYRLTAGQSLKLPAAAASSSEQAAAEPKAKGKASDKASDKAAGQAEETTVAKGDTLAAIARKHGVSVDELARLNGLDKPYRLKVGQTIKLKGEEDAAASDKGANAGARTAAKAKAGEQDQTEGLSTSTITVRRHDTIQSLARQAHVSVADLARLNHLKKPYRLKPGQSIKLPDQPGALASRAESGRPLAADDERPSAPTVVIAGRKDTLKGIAEKHGVSLETLARLNHLKKPYRIKRGQKIKLPAPPAKERPHAQTARNEADRNQTSYKVQAGDTLYSIARRFGTDARTVAELNGMESGDSLKAGRTIRLPGGAEDQIAPEVASRAAPPPVGRPSRPLASQAPSTPVPYSSLPSNPPVPPAPGLAPPAPPPPSSSAVASLPPPSASASTPAYRPTAPAPEPVTAGDAEVAAAGKGLFLWPVRGDVIQRFGPLVGGQRNDGVDIAGAAGDRVVAAAAGEVVYAGNSVPGFGNLVLIRHDGGWVTAYAHLKSLDVKMRQTVAQGQEIGAVGQTGGVSQPQLHFEVRYAPTTRDKARPIDPMLVLPQ